MAGGGGIVPCRPAVQESLALWLDFRALGPSARIAVLSFFDIVMVWNPGVSYGLSPRQPTGAII